jgi:hypothetical protein
MFHFDHAEDLVKALIEAGYDVKEVTDYEAESYEGSFEIALRVTPRPPGEERDFSSGHPDGDEEAK